eukprot:jgi/Picsp_1/3339/NSC_06176-R2_morn repeat protein
MPCFSDTVFSTVASTLAKITFTSDKSFFKEVAASAANLLFSTPSVKFASPRTTTSFSSTSSAQAKRVVAPSTRSTPKRSLKDGQRIILAFQTKDYWSMNY